MTRIKAELDAQIKVFDAHLEAATEQRESERAAAPRARRARDRLHHVSDPTRPRDAGGTRCRE